MTAVAIGIVALGVALLLLNEATELAPLLAAMTLRWGARKLAAPEKIERYGEEWPADLECVPGKLRKLWHALGVVVGSVPRLRSRLAWQPRPVVSPFAGDAATPAVAPARPRPAASAAPPVPWVDSGRPVPEVLGDPRSQLRSTSDYGYSGERGVGTHEWRQDGPWGAVYRVRRQSREADYFDRNGSSDVRTYGVERSRAYPNEDDLFSNDRRAAPPVIGR